MKRLKMLVLLLLCAAVLTACGGGDVRHVRCDAGTSEIYSTAEIRKAMDTVIDHFKKEFEGCTLTRLEYDESYVESAQTEWAAQYDADQAIVLISEFDVDSSGGDGSLNPDSTYRNWQWVLVRNGSGAWELKTCGYG